MTIKDAVARASEYLAEHPDEARYRDDPARATLTAGLRVRVSGARGESLETDMPAGIGGTGSRPSPGWYLRAATASCVASLVAIRAAATDVAIQGVEVVVDSESDDRGILGLDPDVPAGPLSARVEVRVAAHGVAPEVLDSLVAWAVGHCPISDALARSVPVETRRI